MILKNFRTYHLAKELYQLCQRIPCKAPVKDQLRRASLSVILNLAEGSAKPTIKERRRFYSISFASLRETQVILDLLEQNEVLALADHVGACLYKLSRPTAP